MNPLNLNKEKLKYDVMIGVGGIGSGSFFMLNGNHTLGREESRSGRFLVKDDYCKLHIISHYVKALLGPSLEVMPAGKIGKDDIGRKLLSEMNEIGLSTKYIETDPENPTLFSFCFLYPDKSGGNMTTDNSACSTVDEFFVQKTETEFKNFEGRGIALAAPEVSLKARARLLELARKYKFFSVASFTSEEIIDAAGSGILKNVNLLCINIDEASSALKTKSGKEDDVEIAEKAVKDFIQSNPSILVSITNGKEGSFLWDGTGFHFQPTFKIEAVSSAGAGDAFTAGMIAGIVSGLDLKDVQVLASLTGACSVTSPHTINKELDRAALLNLALSNKSALTKSLLKILEN